MGNGNGNIIGSKFTFGVVLRGQLEDINILIEFLKQSNLVVAHQEIGQEKMWIKKDGDDAY